MSTNPISGEQSNTKFLAVFDTEADLEQCKVTLEEAGYDPRQLAVIAPHERNYSRKIEPEPKGIFRTAIKAHVLFAILGFLLGLGLWAGLYWSGVALIASSPVVSVIPFLFIFTSAGLLLGGFMTLRPDHLLVIQGVKTAKREGRWSLVVHSRNPTQTVQVEQWFETANISFTRSL